MSAQVEIKATLFVTVMYLTLEAINYYYYCCLCKIAWHRHNFGFSVAVLKSIFSNQVQPFLCLFDMSDEVEMLKCLRLGRRLWQKGNQDLSETVESSSSRESFHKISIQGFSAIQLDSQIWNLTRSNLIRSGQVAQSGWESEFSLHPSWRFFTLLIGYETNSSLKFNYIM